MNIGRIHNEELVLHCGEDGMESDLVFAHGAIRGQDPLFAKQMDILQHIVTMESRIRDNEIQITRMTETIRERNTRVSRLEERLIKRKDIIAEVNSATLDFADHNRTTTPKEKP